MRSVTKFMFFCFATLVLTAGCSKQSSQIIRVAQFTNDPVLIKIINGMVANIQKRHPEIQVRLETIPYGNYQEKITTQLSAGNAPDVMAVEVNNCVDLYLRGVFEDLMPYARKDGIDLKGFYPGVLRRFTRDGRLFVLPSDTSPTGIVYYNKKLFRQAGVPYPTNQWTWPEPFLSMCKKLTKKDATGKYLYWAYSEAYPIQFDNFLYSNGGSLVDDVDHPTRLTLDSPQAMKAIQFRWDMIHKYGVSPTPSEVQSFSFNGGVEDMFLHGKIVMMVSGIWHTPLFLQDKDLDFDVVQFPAGPTGQHGWSTGGSGYAMCKACKNKELAWIVLKEIAGETTTAQFTQTGMFLPASLKLAHSDVFLKAPGAAHKAILLDMPQYSHYQPFMKNWAEVAAGAIGPAMDPVWIGNKTPSEVLPGLTRTINEKFFNQKQ